MGLLASKVHVRHHRLQRRQVVMIDVMLVRVAVEEIKVRLSRGDPYNERPLRRQINADPILEVSKIDGLSGNLVVLCCMKNRVQLTQADQVIIAAELRFRQRGLFCVPLAPLLEYLTKSAHTREIGGNGAEVEGIRVSSSGEP